MIGAVRGRIVSSEPGRISVETPSGLSLSIMVPVSSFPDLKSGSETHLHTTLRLRDDVFQLYGFTSLEQRSWFEELIAISGIGGKTAMAMISAFSSGELADMIESGDFLRLSSVPGIGRKTAQRVVLEMSGRLARIQAETGGKEESQVEDDLVSGLVNLGFTPKSARQAVKQVLQSSEESGRPFNELLKTALKRISRS